MERGDLDSERSLPHRNPYVGVDDDKKKEERDDLPRESPHCQSKAQRPAARGRNCRGPRLRRPSRESFLPRTARAPPRRRMRARRAARTAAAWPALAPCLRWGPWAFPSDGVSKSQRAHTTAYTNPSNSAAAHPSSLESFPRRPQRRGRIAAAPHPPGLGRAGGPPVIRRHVRIAITSSSRSPGGEP